MTAEELTTFLKSVAELTTALNAFVVLAEELFPHPDNGLPLMRRLRAWRRANPHTIDSDISHEDTGSVDLPC